MTWETIHDYLRKVEKAANAHRGNLVLLREVAHVGPIVITQNNWQWGYLKPDEGYGSRLQLYKVKDAAKGATVTSWGLYQFPSCCALCVSTLANVVPEFRNSGINKLSNQLRQKIAAHEGYAALICTDVMDNTPERRTLVSEDFVDIFQVHNPRTGNEVMISVKRLL